MIFTPLPPCPPHPECKCGHPVQFELDVNPTRHCCTVCTGNVSNNIWFQPGPPGFPGRCILDELTYDQVYAVLLRNHMAKRDLQQITSDPTLLQLANSVNLEVDPLDDDQYAAKRIHANTLPFYTLFRGNIDGTQNRR